MALADNSVALRTQFARQRLVFCWSLFCLSDNYVFDHSIPGFQLKAKLLDGVKTVGNGLAASCLVASGGPNFDIRGSSSAEMS